ncbi:MAG: hypothetical protein VX730_07540 [Pseudomonadota bacterium]|nr:hypothetical protein [Pseudomonadota bacterium]
MLKDRLQVTTDASDSTPVQVSIGDLSTPEKARAAGVRTAKKLAQKTGKYALCMSPKAKNVHEFAIGFGQGVPAFSMKSDAAVITVSVPDAHVDVFQAAALGIAKARQLVVAPANIATPSGIANQIERVTQGNSAFSRRGYHLQKNNFTEVIGRSSENTPQLVTVLYKGNDDSDELDLGLAFKGCTFDSGGMNMKPSASVSKMKKDMGAAALGVGLLKWLSIAKPKVNVVLGFSMAENAVSSTAMRTGDIYPFKGKSVEITNTDAEGRLLLADAMLAMSTQYPEAPNALIALGTLTALGKSVFGGSRIPLWAGAGDCDSATEFAGDTSGDLVWSLPLDDLFYKNIQSSQIADYVNSVSGKGAASGVAAVFLHEMAKLCYGEEIDFSMLDISSSAMGGDGVCNYAGEAVHPQDASGACLNLLIHRILQDAA